MRRSSATNTILTLLLASLLVLTPSLGLAATQTDLDEAQRQAEEARQAAEETAEQADAIELDVRALDSAIAGIESDIAYLQTQINEVTARRTALETEIAGLETAITTKRQEIDATQAELDHRNDLLAERMRTTYKHGDLYFIELLLSSKSLRDLIGRTAFIQMVMEQDHRIANELADFREGLEEAKVLLARDLETVATKRQEVVAEENTLRELKAQEGIRLASRASARNQKATLLAETEANAAELLALAEEFERESARIAAELRDSSSAGSGIYNGIMAWPVPASTRITSPFGWRIHPIFGTTKFHSGIDIGAPSGSTVVSAGSGIVIEADYGWNGGYGNRILIDHGEGLVTTYNHLLNGSFRVVDGQAVAKGEAIAGVGSTGYSTGPHLHFETRVNGTPVDPMGYVS